MKETAKQEHKVGDLQQEVRQLTRDTLQKDRQVGHYTIFIITLTQHSLFFCHVKQRKSINN